MYWFAVLQLLKLIKSQSLFIHLTWMEISWFTALKIWICLRAMDNEDFFTMANVQGRALVKSKYCPFLGIGLCRVSPAVPFGKEGRVPRGGGACTAVSWDWYPRRETSFSAAGLSPWGKRLQTLPFQVKRRLIGFIFPNAKYRAKYRLNLTQKVHLETRSLRWIFP